MKNYLNLLTKENKKHLILFIVLNIILVFAETFSIALIPLFIDFIISSDPILPNYIVFFETFLATKNKAELINLCIIFFLIIFFIKNFFYISVIIYQASLKKKFNLYLKKKFLSLYIFAPFEIMKAYNSSEILRNTDSEAQNYVTNFFNILKFSKDFVLLFSIFINNFYKFFINLCRVLYFNFL